MKKKFLLPIGLLAAVLLVALAYFYQMQTNQNIDRTPTGSDSGISSGACGIESCNGLDIVCGTNVPEFCTLEYKLGDFCRQYAVCSTEQGQCALVENEQFTSCKSCVEACLDLPDEEQFECENTCRTDAADQELPAGMLKPGESPLETRLRDDELPEDIPEDELSGDVDFSNFAAQ